MFRSIGGSIGVSLFGAIFNASLLANLAAALPAQHLSAAASPTAILALPTDERAVYLHVFTAALHPVFVYAASIGVVAFALTWLMREVPLRTADQQSSARDKAATSYAENETAPGGS